MVNNPAMNELWYVLECLSAASIAIDRRDLAGRKLNRESKLDLLVDLGLVDWTQSADGRQEIYTLNARGRKALTQYRHTTGEL
jgi:hypothetical protein